MQYARNHKGSIKRNHSNALPRHVVIYDTETAPLQSDKRGRRFSHSFKIAVAIVFTFEGLEPTNVRLVRIERPSAFWQLLYTLTSQRHTTWVVSPKMLPSLVVSGFTQEFAEARVLIDWPRSKRKKEDNNEDNVHASTLAIIENPPTIVALKATATNGRFVCLDIANWFSATLIELGEAAGLKARHMPHDNAPDEEWYLYCERNCRICYILFVELMQWVKRNDMGMFRYTAASQAMAAFRHRFMPHNITPHREDEVKALERRAYFGGRTEMFRQGEFTSTVHQYDVNALYPATMEQLECPCMLHKFDLREDWTKPPANIKWAKAVAEVEVYSPMPLLPKRRNNIIIYPIGRFTTCLCGEELDFAIRYGMVNMVKSWAEYRTAKLFGEWVIGLWQMRQEYKAAGNVLYAKFAKSLANSLYGKFGQLSPRWVNVEASLAALPWSRWVEGDVLTNTRTQYRAFGWQVQRKSDREEIDGTFVAISAFVTSAARMRMNALRSIAGPRNVYYQGCDSLIVNDEGQHNLQNANAIADDELGKLRHQMTTNYGTIYGCSDYRIGDKTVISGRSKLRIAEANGEIMQRKMLADRHLFDGTGGTTFDEEIHAWQRQSLYEKGSIGPDGWVKPISLREAATA